MVVLYAGAAGLIQEHAAEASGGPLTVEGGLMVWTVVVFLLLLLVLKRFAWPAILGAVEAREQALEAQLAQAAKDREEAAALLAEHKRLVADARHQATGIVAEARGVAEKEREIAAERERAVADLRREAVDISLAAASKLVGSRLDTETDRRIVSEYLLTL